MSMLRFRFLDSTDLLQMQMCLLLRPILVRVPGMVRLYTQNSGVSSIPVGIIPRVVSDVLLRSDVQGTGSVASLDQLEHATKAYLVFGGLLCRNAK